MSKNVEINIRLDFQTMYFLLFITLLIILGICVGGFVVWFWFCFGGGGLLLFGFFFFNQLFPICPNI